MCVRACDYATTTTAAVAAVDYEYPSNRKTLSNAGFLHAQLHSQGIYTFNPQTIALILCYCPFFPLAPYIELGTCKTLSTL